MIRKRNLIILGILTLCVLNLLFMHASVLQSSQIEEPLDGVSIIDNTCRVILDIWVLITLSIIFFRGQLKYSILVSFLITFIWSFSNVLYSRFFYHYITLSSMGEAGALADGLVIDSILAGIQIRDVYYVIVLIVFLFLYHKCTSISVRIWSFLKIVVVCVLSIYVFDLLSHMFYCASQADLRYWGYYKRRVGRRVFGQNHFLALPIYAHFHNGSVKSLVIESIMSMQDNIELDDNQKSIINKALKESEASMTASISNKKVQNVIFILIESQMSFVIDMSVDGNEVTPCLNALKADSTVYYNGNVRSNITLGESADGQYIYMTGLLPLRSMVTVSKACKRKLPGLPRQFKKIGITHSRMILPTSSSLWRQDDMCEQYGFDHLYASNDYPGEHLQTLTDKQVFELASLIDKKENDAPFFSIVLTASMHQPYDKIIDSTFVIKDPSMNEELKYYLNACHYTDHSIGDYLLSLKQNGLYDNSLIVIAADHHVHSTDFGGGISNNIPFFIINGNLPQDIYKGLCNQLDLYTTILNIMNVPNAWPGLGRSLLNNNYRRLKFLNLKNRWDVSEWILMSDYFKEVDTFL